MLPNLETSATHWFGHRSSYYSNAIFKKHLKIHALALAPLSNCSSSHQAPMVSPKFCAPWLRCSRAAALFSPAGSKKPASLQGLPVINLCKYNPGLRPCRKPASSSVLLQLITTLLQPGHLALSCLSPCAGKVLGNSQKVPSVSRI